MGGVDVGGAALGAAFGSVLKIVQKAARTTYHFKSNLNLIKETLISLKPMVDRIASSEDNKMLIDQLEAGEKLVLKCSKIKRWDLPRKYKYSRRLSKFQNQLLLFFQMDVQAQLVCNILETPEGQQDDLRDNMDRMHLISGGNCNVSGLPDFIVGLDEPLKALKGMVLQNGVSVVVLSAPGGSGKTTLSKMLCKDKEIKDKYGNNTFFVTVSKTASLKDVIQKIFQHKDLSLPQFQNEEDAINQLEILMRRLEQGILLVLDDVCSEWESLIEKFKFEIDDYKILIVKVCKGFPLALTVIGRSLYGKHLVIWDQRAKKCLDALDEKPIAKECYLDLGSFPEDQKIAATVIMDMWAKLYGQDDEGAETLGNLLGLSFRNHVNLLPTRELVISRSDQEPMEQRKILIMDIKENVPPQWLVEQQQQPKHARLLSISTDETFASSWYNMQLPSTEVLVLNFRSKNYLLPHFMETMNKLKENQIGKRFNSLPQQILTGIEEFAENILNDVWDWQGFWELFQ
ncbi:hypothetical protein LguiB_009208 [Lonicera macranthoides]